MTVKIGKGELVAGGVIYEVRDGEGKLISYILRDLAGNFIDSGSRENLLLVAASKAQANQRFNRSTEPPENEAVQISQRIIGIFLEGGALLLIALVEVQNRLQLWREDDDQRQAVLDLADEIGDEPDPDEMALRWPRGPRP